jgi:TolB-like protein/Tfp pilus assembly protein PilF/predicted Ser/Thr protein kinase
MTEFGAVHDGARVGDSPIMSSAPRVCRKCGAEIFADAPEGLCTACLFETGLGLLANASVAGVGDADSHDSEQARGKKKTPRSTNTFADFGDYELLEVIGRGGQGVVYRARQKSLNRVVALKVIGLGHWATEAHLKRFRREAEAAASLDHSGIVPIYEVGERDGSCYFSMKLVEGGQLDELIKREPMPIRRAVELIAKVARTVHYAHEHSILHRDIKPGNILFDQKGEPHLTDFGLARLIETESTVTRTMEVLGTPSYMAPEQAAGNNAQLTAATDVYGLGAVFYQLLTGHPPFAGGTTFETIKLLLDTEPRRPCLWNPKVDRDLSTICLKCLEKDPKRRYSSALALAEDLERWLKHEPILARRAGILTRCKKWVQRNPTGTLLAASLVALAAAAAWIVWKSEFIRHPLTTGIAVLPFENLSDEKEHEFFADGVQDDILTKLGKIADLKVISRSSVMQYRGKQDVRQIGKVLRVSHVLEATVRRSSGKVHVNAQLVDARTDAGIWAEEYDRDLNEVFAIETEVAQSIANRLRAKVSLREKAALQERPTKDLVAYDLYARAKPVIEWAGIGPTQEKNVLQAVDLLNQAIARDPEFLRAYCWLARAHDTLYFEDLDHTPARLDLANSAINSAFRINPDSGEAHLALAVHRYWSSFDYDGALDELAIARRTLPNNPEVYYFSGLIDRRQGRWSEAVHNFERASELDPRNAFTVNSLAAIYCFVRAYQQCGEAKDRVVALQPDNARIKLERAMLDISWRADTRPLRAAIEKVAADDPAHAENEKLNGARFFLAFCERDAVTAGRTVAVLPEKDLNDDVGLGRAFWTGLIARMTGDAAAAHAAFDVARGVQQELARARPDSGARLSGLGLIDAGLGRKEDAIREGREALELTPIAKDSLQGPEVVTSLAAIYAWVGERDLAIEQLEISAKVPNGVHYGDLRLDPTWDPLRGDPRFEKIVASLAPK